MKCGSLTVNENRDLRREEPFERRMFTLGNHNTREADVYECKHIRTPKLKGLILEIASPNVGPNFERRVDITIVPQQLQPSM